MNAPFHVDGIYPTTFTKILLCTDFTINLNVERTIIA